jgi:hypothetical protein
LQNWNFNREEGRAASNINFWKKSAQDEARRFSGWGSADCVSCYAAFRVDARIKYELKAGVHFFLSPFFDFKFMAEFSLQAIANIDLQLNMSGSYEYEPPALQLARIQPMLNSALGAFNILSIPLTLSVSFGLDISVGIKFKAQALLFLSAGADLVCNYKYGVYMGYERNATNNGCKFNYHPLVANASAAIQVNNFVQKCFKYSKSTAGCSLRSL